MVKRIAIIGCGNIGSRHLQALTQLPFSVEINAVEPNSKSQQLAIRKIKEIKYDEKTHEILWFKHLSE